EYLGHADPGFTLRVYAHLFPASEDRARKAVEAAFSEALREPPTARHDPRPTATNRRSDGPQTDQAGC
ncbi:MAG: hypothetical protein ACRD2W_22495, partial [Acidimicrobiales bacterium]